MYYKNKNNDPFDALAITFKVIGIFAIIAILKYVAIAFGMIALLVGAYYLIKEKISEQFSLVFKKFKSNLKFLKHEFEKIVLIQKYKA